MLVVGEGCFLVEYDPMWGRDSGPPITLFDGSVLVVDMDGGSDAQRPHAGGDAQAAEMDAAGAADARTDSASDAEALDAAHASDASNRSADSAALA
ncbi:MAG: hypothetical protein JWN04_1269, partial [Myxococcaceae bacterium]|nr:hypothetical protein [Myxococcaceae bacterium]